MGSQYPLKLAQNYRRAFMSYKTIDVTLASIRNVGPEWVGPKGAIYAQRARAQDDEQIFQTEILYNAELDGPIHPNGARGIAPGQSLIYNVTKRFSIHDFGDHEIGGLNEMLMFDSDLIEKFIISGHVETKPYFGTSYYHVQFIEIGDGFQTITTHCGIYGVTEYIKHIEITFTTNLIARG
jgi:hypothetical protein